MKQGMQAHGGIGLAIVLSATIALPAIAQFGAGGGGGFGGFNTGRRSSLARPSAQELLRQRQAELDLSKEKMQALRARYETGSATLTELRSAELDLMQAQSAVAAAQLEVTREKRLQDLNRFVDVDLQGATVRQAAQALSKASGLPIKVDDKISNEARITVRGRSVPIAVLLDRLGNRANLMISPSEDGQGVELDVWPALELDGERTIYKGPLAPWSTEWGTVPIMGVYQSESIPSPAGLGAPQPMVTPGGTSSKAGTSRTSPPKPAGGTFPEVLPGGYPGLMSGSGMGLSGMPGMAMAPGSAAFPAASIGVGNGSIVIAEPGVKDGQVGLWLTVYKLSGTSLLKIGTGFHKSGAAPGSGRKPSGRPGMSGAFGGAPGASPYGGVPAAPYTGNPYAAPHVESGRPYGAASVGDGFGDPDGAAVGIREADLVPSTASTPRIVRPSAPKPTAGGVLKAGTRRPLTVPAGKSTPKP